MKIICVDDEKIVLKHTVFLCESLEYKPKVFGFSRAGEALSHVKEQGVDIAILDIEMPEINGLMLATKIKEICPDSSIIFLTGYSNYATDAFRLHASGYLLKPVNKEDIEKEVAYALSNKPYAQPAAHIAARTFGEFDLLVDGVPVVLNA